jgi:ribosome-binding ATPase YchF (GTP1/OBG family)
MNDTVEWLNELEIKRVVVCIRAEVVSFTDFVANNGWSGAKSKGRLRVEGKEYVVADGDIMEILHS